MEKLSFQPLSIDGSNYLSWSLDTEAHLNAKGLQDTILTDAGPTLQQKAQGLILIRHHLAYSLKRQYLNEANPRILWDELQSGFNHTRTIALPAARHDWINLRVQDHKSMAEYNSELFRIVAQLALCGHPVQDEEQIEKTLSTLHSTNLVLATQYRNMKFQRYSELIAHMLLSEKHQLLLLQNTKARPPALYLHQLHQKPTSTLGGHLQHHLRRATNANKERAHTEGVAQTEDEVEDGATSATITVAGAAPATTTAAPGNKISPNTNNPHVQTRLRRLKQSKHATDAAPEATSNVPAGPRLTLLIYISVALTLAAMKHMGHSWNRQISHLRSTSTSTRKRVHLWRLHTAASSTTALPTPSFKIDHISTI